mmetsp:Transcript_4043/g.10018  ORF Transcript_4043/g.10018 Transcript_4043/m.10018 type:complete len:205 (+) Transcript_4043:276-890(+)
MPRAWRRELRSGAYFFQHAAPRRCRRDSQPCKEAEARRRGDDRRLAPPARRALPPVLLRAPSRRPQRLGRHPRLPPRRRRTRRPRPLHRHRLRPAPPRKPRRRRKPLHAEPPRRDPRRNRPPEVDRRRGTRRAGELRAAVRREPRGVVLGAARRRGAADGFVGGDCHGIATALLVSVGGDGREGAARAAGVVGEMDGGGRNKDF